MPLENEEPGTKENKKFETSEIQN
jgi:hypothetical protein